jgi:cell division protein FtsB
MSDQKQANKFLHRINLFLFVFFLLVGLMFLYYPKYRKLYQLKERERTLDKEIADKQAEIDDLKERQKALTEDREYLEKVARDKLGYSGSKEIIYQFEDTNGKKDAATP